MRNPTGLSTPGKFRHDERKDRIITSVGPKERLALMLRLNCISLFGSLKKTTGAYNTPRKIGLLWNVSSRTIPPWLAAAYSGQSARRRRSHWAPPQIFPTREFSAI